MTAIRNMTARDWWVFLTSPRGRINRFDYNVKFLILFFGLGLIAGFIDYACLGPAVTKPGARTYATWFVQIISLWPSIIMAIKRLHDMDYSGWWLVPSYVVPIIVGSGLIGYFLVHQNMIGVTLTGLLILAVMMTVIIIFCCAKGTPGPNRFGPQPDMFPVRESVSR